MNYAQCIVFYVRLWQVLKEIMLSEKMQRLQLIKSCESLTDVVFHIWKLDLDFGTSKNGYDSIASRGEQTGM